MDRYDELERGSEEKVEKYCRDWEIKKFAE